MNPASIDTTGSPTPEAATPAGAEAPKAVAASKAARKVVRKAAPAKAEAEPAVAVSAKPVKPVKPVKAAKPAPVAKPAATVKPAAVKKPGKVLKVAKPARAVKAVLPAAPVQAAVPLKVKLVRDSFTMPELEYAQLDALKQRALSLAHHAKKSEVLRAGITALAAMGDAELLAALKAVPPLKTGRPKARKGDKAQGDDKPAGKTKVAERKA